MNIQMPDFLKILKTNKYYKFSGFLFGILLILSLFFELKNTDINFIRNLSMWFVIGSMGAWLIDSFSYHLSRWMVDHVPYKKRGLSFLILLVFEYSIQVCLWFYILRYQLALI